jgi:hypothetical protein
MAGRGRGQSGQRCRGRGDACRISVEDLRPDYDVEFERIERGRPAPRVGAGDEQERRGARRGRGSASTAAQVSDLHPAQVTQGLGRCSDECGRRGRGRGVGTVRSAKGKNFVPEEERNCRPVEFISRYPW